MNALDYTKKILFEVFFTLAVKLDLDSSIMNRVLKRYGFMVDLYHYEDVQNLSHTYATLDTAQALDVLEQYIQSMNLDQDVISDIIWNSGYRPPEDYADFINNQTEV